MTNDYQVPAVNQAIEVLKYLSNNEENRSLSEISQNLSMNKSSCMRILKTLEKSKFVSYDETSKEYSLGPFLVALGNQASEEIDYISRGKTFLNELAKHTSLTSVLVNKISDDRLMNIAKKEQMEGGIRVAVTVGKQFYITETSYGKWFLAYGDEQQREIYINKLRKLTPFTITDTEEYKKNLEKIKKVGYAVSREEYILGVNVISAPVFNIKGEIILVIACIGIASLMDESDINSVGAHVKRVAEEFSEFQ
ncbi:IclR family transcriptional regulator [Mesobacillus harenae]|uniref:IclR family transcriptional regulator n=1 Tax=Mesobacillus harenae TaxID=2213203 RepID=UPI0015803762|nr:IclR family transcriptional regulator [Mesobacillus harenae]